jgi:hypothetical protein
MIVSAVGDGVAFPEDILKYHRHIRYGRCRCAALRGGQARVCFWRLPSAKPSADNQRCDLIKYDVLELQLGE